MKNILHFFDNLWFMTIKSIRFAPWYYVVSLFYLAKNTLMPFINLLFPKWILDELCAGKRWEVVLNLILLWAAINIAFFFIDIIDITFVSTLVDKYDVKESLLYANLDAQMDYSKIEDGKLADEKNRIYPYIRMLHFSEDFWLSILSTLLQLIGYAYIVSTLHPLAVLFLVGIAFCKIAVAKKDQKDQYYYEERTAGYKRKFDFFFRSMIDYSNAKEVRINRADRLLHSKYKKQVEEYLLVYGKNQKRKFLIGNAQDFISFLQSLFLFLYSVYKTIVGEITIGSFFVYIGAVAGFTDNASGLLDHIINISNLSRYIDSYKKYLNDVTPENKKKKTLIPMPVSSKHEIEFDHVSFKYPGSDVYVLHDISLLIRDGERLSIVGENGAGKSTLVKLICRLYEPTEGRILYNGIDINTLDYIQYLKQFSVVFQDYNLFSMSIRENLSFENDYSEEEAMNVLAKCGLKEKITNLPHKLDTELGKEFNQDGVEFSGGEGQKLACARAYLKNAPIVILDEPTASLDPISENQLYEQFEEIMGKKTAIYISHRLASSKFCDKIAVLSEGKILEYGTHKELMKVHGVYWNMFSKQAHYYVDKVEGL